MRSSTQNQQRILDFIKSEIDIKGYPPSVREICAAVGLRSTSTVHAHLNHLEQQGLIRRDSTKPRALARRQDTARISDRPEGWREMLRQQVIDCTLEQVRSCADVLSKLPERRAVCVFGGKQLIEASEAELEVIDLMGD